MLDEPDVIENAPNKMLAFGSELGLQCHAMVTKAKKTEKRPRPIQLRPTVSDSEIIAAGIRKYGFNKAQILRVALRRFAESEGFELKTA